MALHEHRVTYPTIKQWVMEAYFDFCRDRGVVMGRPHAEILGGVSYEYEGCFERPVERLMLEVVCMVLNGGWYQQPMDYHREQIQKILVESSLENLLSDVPQEEADLFRHDLKILKLI
jgi:hypothetical protein